MARPAGIPTFYLYGEPQRSVGQGFVHVESLDDRSRPSEWTIRPHSHPELHHIFLLTTGGGQMRAEGHALDCPPPCLMLVPAGIVHGFEWIEETRGWVVTMADGYVADLIRHDRDLAPLFRAAAVVALDAAEGARVAAGIADLARELGWAAPGHRAAVDATLLAILVTAVRRAAPSTDLRGEVPAPQAAIVARLRERIEQRFRLREPVAAHAAALGVSATALRVACTRVSGMPPALMLDQRALLEARRALLYSTLSVAEIGYSVGFADPAYFSRFFTRHVGRSPRQYRAMPG